METTPATAAPATRWIDLSLIDIPKNARPHRPEDLDSLAQDMDKEGQLQEIVVTTQGDRFEVVAGVGRTLAAQKLKWEKIRCFVKDGLSEFDRLHITFSENEEREDASPVYQAQLLNKMLEAGQGKTQEELAQRIGKGRSVIAQYMVIAKLPPEVQEIVTRVTNLGLKHLLQICRLQTPEEQIALAKEASEKDLSVKELKTLVDKAVNGEKQEANGSSPLAVPSSLSPFKFTRHGTQVKITAAFESTDSLDDFFVELRKALTSWTAKRPGAKKSQASGPVMTPIAPSPIRLAETPEEEAELQALAAASPGPAAAYAWVYGKDSPVTRSAEKATWGDTNPSDPREFVKQFFKRNQ